MKTVVIDCRFAGGKTGLGRYTREITRHLLRRSDDIRYVLLVRSRKEEWIPSDAETREADMPHYSFAEQLRLPGLLTKTGADLFFSPHFNVPLFCPLPYVVTIHDLILHRFPNNASFPKRFAYQILMKHAVLRARKVIAITEFVKTEIQSHYPSRSDVAVIYEGVSGEYTPRSQQEVDAVRERYNLQRPFFLYVGNAKQHKNVSTLLHAFEASGVTDRELVLVSGGAEAKSLSLPRGVRLLEQVPDADLPVLYSAAEALVTASLYEGFCLPLAEALACGCPVVASDGTAIAELGKGNATLIEPTVENFSRAFQRSYSKHAPVIIGRWEQTAEETAALLRKALQI